VDGGISSIAAGDDVLDFDTAAVAVADDVYAGASRGGLPLVNAVAVTDDVYAGASRGGLPLVNAVVVADDVYAIGNIIFGVLVYTDGAVVTMADDGGAPVVVVIVLTEL
jgi:hypothetical protein